MIVRRVDSRPRVSELRDALVLSVIPIGVAILFAMLLLPRQGVPDVIPLPIPDVRELTRLAAIDRDRAAAARRDALPDTVRALGSAVRAYHVLEAANDLRGLAKARGAVDAALVEALQEGDEPLLQLRAVELEGFLAELTRFESTGLESNELTALAGDFVRTMASSGWAEGRTIAPNEAARRAMFKEMWNGFLGLDMKPEFALALDEERALYSFFLSHPHPSSAARKALAQARRGARDKAACHQLEEAERVATETWRLEHIERISAIDPTYPAAYAHGVATFWRGDYRAAARDFQTWLTAHPDGSLALRARSFLRAAASRRPAE